MLKVAQYLITTVKGKIIDNVAEITGHAIDAFTETFEYLIDDPDSDPDFHPELGDGSDSESDSDLDFCRNPFDGCPDVTPEREAFVSDHWESCDPIEKVFGPSTSLVKQSVTKPIDDDSCLGVNIIGELTPAEDRDLLRVCTAIAYSCCCETLKKTSPIIAEATTNLFY